MRRVVGNKIIDLPNEKFERLRAHHRAILLDVGTGDGKHAYRVAGERPDWLVVGVDANPDHMRATSVRAAAKPARGGRANLVLVWSSAQALPPAVRGVAELHVLMPWGSLLRGLLGDELSLLDTLGGACRRGADFLVTLNLHAWRPPVPEVADLDEPTPHWARRRLAARYAEHGWRLDDARYLDAAEIRRLATSWTRRLEASKTAFDVLALTGTVGV